MDTLPSEIEVPGRRPVPAWLRSESKRATVSAIAATVLTFVVEFLWLAREPALQAHAWAVGCVLAWTFFAAGHTLLILRAYRDAGPEDFRADGDLDRSAAAGGDESGTWWSRVRRLVRRWWRGWSNAGNEAPSWSVQVSVLALIVVALIMVTPGLRSSQGLLFAALAMVASSWANVVVMFAVHYARIDTRTGGLRFPGDGEQRGFVDYLYLSLAVQTTFGTTDVEICTQLLRRTTMVHGILSFVFNSVIVAMIVSLLLGVVQAAS